MQRNEPWQRASMQEVDRRRLRAAFLLGRARARRAHARERRDWIETELADLQERAQVDKLEVTEDE